MLQECVCVWHLSEMVQPLAGKAGSEVQRQILTDSKAEPQILENKHCTPVDKGRH